MSHTELVYRLVIDAENIPEIPMTGYEDVSDWRVAYFDKERCEMFIMESGHDGLLATAYFHPFYGHELFHYVKEYINVKPEDVTADDYKLLMLSVKTKCLHKALADGYDVKVYASKQAFLEDMYVSYTLALYPHLIKHIKK